MHHWQPRLLPGWIRIGPGLLPLLKCVSSYFCMCGFSLLACGEFHSSLGFSPILYKSLGSWDTKWNKGVASLQSLRIKIKLNPLYSIKVKGFGLNFDISCNFDRQLSPLYFMQLSSLLIIIYNYSTIKSYLPCFPYLSTQVLHFPCFLIRQQFSFFLFSYILCNPLFLFPLFYASSWFVKNGTFIFFYFFIFSK